MSSLARSLTLATTSKRHSWEKWSIKDIEMSSVTDYKANGYISNQ